MSPEHVERDYFEDGIPVNRPDDGSSGVRQPSEPTPIEPAGSEPLVLRVGDLSELGQRVLNQLRQAARKREIDNQIRFDSNPRNFSTNARAMIRMRFDDRAIGPRRLPRKRSRS